MLLDPGFVKNRHMQRWFANLVLFALLHLFVIGCSPKDHDAVQSTADRDFVSDVASQPTGQTQPESGETTSQVDAAPSAESGQVDLDGSTKVESPSQETAANLASGIVASETNIGSESETSDDASGDNEQSTASGGGLTPAELTSASSRRFGPRRPPPGQEQVEDKPLSPIEKARREAARRRGDLTFDDLKFEIEKGGEFKRDMLSEDIESFGGRTIKIRGYMYPTFKQDGIKEFVLVRDNLECCFGPGAAIYDCIRIKMEPGKTTSFSVRPISVKGKFEIEEFRLPDGYLAAIFKMTATEVR